jgi:hypothetical protein
VWETEVVSSGEVAVDEAEYDVPEYVVDDSSEEVGVEDAESVLEVRDADLVLDERLLHVRLVLVEEPVDVGSE